MFYCDIAATDLTIGPVRSARTYFLDWASEYGKYPIYVHVGGANTPNKANALGQIRDYGWQGVNDLNQFGLGVKECWRDDTILKKANNIDRVATEHTMYCSTENLYKAAQKRGITNLDKKAIPGPSRTSPGSLATNLIVAPVNWRPASTLTFGRIMGVPRHLDL